ncbi:MAG: four helix bundle protein [Bacteroidales bacterium]|jgi:four helix bundle protein|nr:four helix bundle protein [Bacteroidales bacterium]
MERNSNIVFNEQMRDRTKKMALNMISLCNKKLKQTNEVEKILIRQLVRSSTSVAANYRAAIRGRSRAEFYSKMCIVVEEADETQFWLEILKDSKILNEEVLEPLYEEITEILAITTTIKHNLKKTK